MTLRHFIISRASDQTSRRPGYVSFFGIVGRQGAAQSGSGGIINGREAAREGLQACDRMTGHRSAPRAAMIGKPGLSSASDARAAPGDGAGLADDDAESSWGLGTAAERGSERRLSIAALNAGR